MIWNSLTVRPYANNEVSYGTLLMFLVTWFFGGLLTLTELRRRNVISARDIWLATAPVLWRLDRAWRASTG